MSVGGLKGVGREKSESLIETKTNHCRGGLEVLSVAFDNGANAGKTEKFMEIAKFVEKFPRKFLKNIDFLKVFGKNC